MSFLETENYKDKVDGNPVILAYLQRELSSVQLYRQKLMKVQEKTQQEQNVLKNASENSFLWRIPGKLGLYLTKNFLDYTTNQLAQNEDNESQITNLIFEAKTGKVDNVRTLVLERITQNIYFLRKVPAKEDTTHQKLVELTLDHAKVSLDVLKIIDPNLASSYLPLLVHLEQKSIDHPVVGAEKLPQKHRFLLPIAHERYGNTQRK